MGSEQVVYICKKMGSFGIIFSIFIRDPTSANHPLRLKPHRFRNAVYQLLPLHHSRDIILHLTMAKKRKSTTTTSLATTAMDLDHPTPLQPKNPILSANTNAGISKPTKKSLHLPRGKGRRAQRLRKEKASERAEEIQGRTERKVERSKGRGKRRGQRNVCVTYECLMGTSLGAVLKDGLC